MLPLRLRLTQLPQSSRRAFHNTAYRHDLTWNSPPTITRSKSPIPKYPEFLKKYPKVSKKPKPDTRGPQLNPLVEHEDAGTLVQSVNSPASATSIQSSPSLPSSNTPTTLDSTILQAEPSQPAFSTSPSSPLSSPPSQSAPSSSSPPSSSNSSPSTSSASLYSYPELVQRTFALCQFNHRKPFRASEDFVKLNANLSKQFTYKRFRPTEVDLLPHVEGSCLAADLWFPQHPMPVKEYIAVLITLYTAVEKILSAEIPTEYLEKSLLEACRTFGNEKIQYFDPTINIFARWVRLETEKFYGPYATGAMIKSTYDYFLGATLEWKHLKGKKLDGKTMQFVRRKVGIPELMAHLLFPQTMFPENEWLPKYIQTIPDNMHLSNSLNDIFSYYKDVEKKGISNHGEDDYVEGVAEREGITTLEVVNRIYQDQERKLMSVTELTEAEPQIAAVCRDFYRGYAAWHFARNNTYMLTDVAAKFNPANDFKPNYVQNVYN
ncbi:hypothetical protein BZA77DRAFT_170350 [Pyronema omphalodes]|nr:hypothetical protein BZA77DRAFT_170350 [Pyronema omphalodes]